MCVTLGDCRIRAPRSISSRRIFDGQEQDGGRSIQKESSGEASTADGYRLKMVLPQLALSRPCRLLRVLVSQALFQRAVWTVEACTSAFLDRENRRLTVDCRCGTLDTAVGPVMAHTGSLASMIRIACDVLWCRLGFSMRMVHEGFSCTF